MWPQETSQAGDRGSLGFPAKDPEPQACQAFCPGSRRVLWGERALPVEAAVEEGKMQRDWPGGGGWQEILPWSAPPITKR